MVVNSESVYFLHNGYVYNNFHGIIRYVCGESFDIHDVISLGIERCSTDFRSIFITFDGHIKVADDNFNVKINVPLFSFDKNPDIIEEYHGNRKIVISNDILIMSSPYSVASSSMLGFDMSRFVACNKYIFGVLWKEYLTELDWNYHIEY